MRSAKAKGSQGERFLVRAFNEAGWVCIRAAGSGSSQFPAPDILAGNALRRVAIECKVTKAVKKYFTKAEIAQLLLFSQKFGAEAWVAIKFGSKQWRFLCIDDLVDTGKSLAASLAEAELKGLLLEDFLGN